MRYHRTPLERESLMRIMDFAMFVLFIFLLGCDEQLMSPKLMESATGGPAFTTADAEPDAVVDAVVDAEADIHLEDPDMAPTLPDMTAEAPDVPPLPADAAPDAALPMPDAAAPPAPLSHMVFEWKLGEGLMADQVSTLSLFAQCVNSEGGFVLAANTQDFEGTSPLISLSLWYTPGPIVTCFVTLVENEALARNELPPGTGSYTIDDGEVQEAPVIVDRESPVFGTWSVQLY